MKRVKEEQIRHSAVEVNIYMILTSSGTKLNLASNIFGCTACRSLNENGIAVPPDFIPNRCVNQKKNVSYQEKYNNVI